MRVRVRGLVGMVKVRGWVTDYAYMKILKKLEVGVCERDGERERQGKRREKQPKSIQINMFQDHEDA